MFEITDFRCESRINPLGLDVEKPRFSWIAGNAVQTAYRITVSDETGVTVWDTGLVTSGETLHAEYAGSALKPETRYTAALEAVSSEGSSKSEMFFETGIMGNDFGAKFITTDRENTAYLRRGFECAKRVKQARLYASALGVYEMSINGCPVGNELLCPGWTSYKNRLQYQTWDVTDKLISGENAMGVRLAEGWYTGDIISMHSKTVTHAPAKFICRLEIEYTDGEKQAVTSDEGWKVMPECPVVMSDYYQGIHYDARLEKPEWDKPGCDDSAWENAVFADEDRKLTGQLDAPVRVIDEIKPVSVFTTPKGEKVIDFGQNMVGFVRFSVRGEAGREVLIRHAEVLDKDGNFYTENYRAAKAEIKYTLRGGETETFAPMLTFFGFRYICVKNWPGELTADDFTGVVICSDIEVTSGFECSDADVNRLFSNIQWGQRGNFVDVPTDCPQRDERLGWTGDCQVFARTACINMDSGVMLSEWLKDLAYDQRADGAVPFVVPNCLNGFGSAAWGDAATVVPWTIYQCYGDKRTLANQYQSMCRWLDFMASQSEGFLWSKGWHFGDWLGLDAYEGSYVGATDTVLIATAYWAYSAELTRRAAEVLGYKDDAQELGTLVDNIKAAYRREFITPTGRLAVATQTAFVLTLHFNLCEEKDRPRIINDFKTLIEKSGNHLTTGFVGTPYLCLTLTECGLHELAGKLFMNRDYPSWLYPVTKGATTMWEHWDGIKPDGTFWSRDMNSYNHYAYGAVGEWMFRCLAGIEPVSPAYKKIKLCPKPIEELSHVSAWQKTPYGRVACSWQRGDDGFYTVTCEVPCGVEAVFEAGGSETALTAGKHTFASVNL